MHVDYISYINAREKKIYLEECVCIHIDAVYVVLVKLEIKMVAAYTCMHSYAHKDRDMIKCV